jgi:hypothetical protein
VKTEKGESCRIPGHLSFGLQLQSCTLSKWAWKDDISTARWGATVCALSVLHLFPTLSDFKIIARNKIGSVITFCSPISSSVFTSSADIKNVYAYWLIRM